MNPDTCEYSKITLPNDEGCIHAVAGYVAGVARKIGCSGTETAAVAEGVRQALSTVLAFSFDPGEQGFVDVACQRIPQGLRIAIRDQGIPLDAGALSPGAAGNHRPDEAIQVASETARKMLHHIRDHDPNR